MLRIFIISVNPRRVKRMRRIFPDLEVFEGVPSTTSNYRQDGIPKTYQKFEAFAVKEGLGRETIVCQDDVWLPNGPGLEAYNASFDTELLIYGHTEASGVVVPKAYSASPAMHRKLSTVWDGEGRVGPAWMSLVESEGHVLDVTRELGGPPSVTRGTGRNAPCVNCP